VRAAPIGRRSAAQEAKRRRKTAKKALNFHAHQQLGAHVVVRCVLGGVEACARVEPFARVRLLLCGRQRTQGGSLSLLFSLSISLYLSLSLSISLSISLTVIMLINIVVVVAGSRLKHTTIHNRLTQLWWVFENSELRYEIAIADCRLRLIAGCRLTRDKRLTVTGSGKKSPLFVRFFFFVLTKSYSSSR
jgi:hypothetical protein